MKNNKRTAKMVLLCIGLVTFITIVAISFAFFTVSYEEGDLYQLGGKAAAELPDITFTENVSGISLSNAYPIPDELGVEKSDEYIFTVQNNSQRNVKINVYLQTSSSNTLADNLVRIKYYNDFYTVGDLPSANPIDTGYNKAYSLGNFILGPHDKNGGNLKYWVNEIGTVENALNRTWSGKIVVTAEFTEEKVFYEYSLGLNFNEDYYASNNSPLQSVWVNADKTVISPRCTINYINFTDRDITLDIEAVATSYDFVEEEQRLTTSITVPAGTQTEDFKFIFKNMTLTEENIARYGDMTFDIDFSVTVTETTNPHNHFTEYYSNSVEVTRSSPAAPSTP